jgi:hypothetical protein
MFCPQYRQLLLVAVAVQALLSSVAEQRAAAQLTLFREAITPPPLPPREDPYPNMMPRNCVECTSRALFFVSML